MSTPCATQIVERLDVIALRLDDIDAKIERLCRAVESMQQSCSNMDNHISFVDSVYDAVQKPLTFVLTQFRGRALPCKRIMRIKGTV